MKDEHQPRGDSATKLLSVLADVLGGQQHSRHTIRAKTGKSLPTADRWMRQIPAAVPVVRLAKIGKTAFLVRDDKRGGPTKQAAAGACIAASLGSLFAGTAQHRNLMDARDYLLAQRGMRVDDLERKFIFTPRGGEHAFPKHAEDLDEIIDALLRNERLRLTYTHNDHRVEKLVLEPLSLVIFEHQFYVFARPVGGALYPYRFVRMSDVERTDETFTYPAVGEYNPMGVLGASFGIHVVSSKPVEEIEIVLSEPWGTYALSHRWHPTQNAGRLSSGDVRVTLRVRHCRELEAWILAFGDKAIVIRPESLRDAIADTVRRAAQRYATNRPSLAKAKAPEKAQKKRAKRGAKGSAG